jgi:hypothetical protein
MAPKRGIGGPGLGRIRRNWEDIENNEPPKPNWLTGQEYPDFEEGRVYADQEYKQLTSPEDVFPLEDKRDGSNYGFGPKFSTRVVKHLFVPNNSKGLNRLVPGPGTVYVKFQKRGDVYAYYNVAFNVYQDFARSTSKGRFINENAPFNDKSSYKNLNRDESVFNI